MMNLVKHVLLVLEHIMITLLEKKVVNVIKVVIMIVSLIDVNLVQLANLVK